MGIGFLSFDGTFGTNGQISPLLSSGSVFGSTGAGWRDSVFSDGMYTGHQAILIETILIGTRCMQHIHLNWAIFDFKNMKVTLEREIVSQ